MMGYSHALSGLAAGTCVLAVARIPADLGWVDPVPVPVQVVFAACVGGAALLPDIDHPSSSVAKSLGPITGLLARGVHQLALELYHSTRGPRDNPTKENGHRLVTHTYVGCLALGLLFGIPAMVSPWAAAVSVGLVVGLLGAGMKRTVGRLLRRTLGIRLAASLFLALVSGPAGYWVSDRYPGWSWVIGAGIFLGCAVHREGDWLTTAGVPRRLWPQMIDGKRWDRVCAPETFDTDSATEHLVMRPIFGVTLALGLLGDFGVLGYLVSVGVSYFYPEVPVAVSGVSLGGSR